jgi:hypothetical protein
MFLQEVVIPANFTARSLCNKFGRELFGRGFVSWDGSVVEGVSKLLGKISEAQSVEGQEEQVMFVNDDDVATHDAEEEGVAMKEEPCGGSGMFSSPGGSLVP